jgi:hypothetical protein
MASGFNTRKRAYEHQHALFPLCALSALEFPKLSPKNQGQG